MYIHGHYYNQHNEKIAVYILTKGDKTQEVEIGSGEGGIYFTDDPVEITQQVNDTFDHLLLYQANVRLLTRQYVDDLFCANCLDAVVNIYRDDVCLFAGYIEPMAYSQGYNEELDELELTCIDCLSALQYAKYKDVGALGVSYNLLKKEAAQRTFLDIVKELLTDVTKNVDLVGGAATMPVYYDGSKALSTSSAYRYSILANVSISELLFLDDSEDDVWTKEDVLTEIMRYLNLHIVQEGLKLYVFDWKTVRNGKDTNWMNIRDASDTVVTTAKTVEIENAIVADCDTQISLDEVYNQLLLTDNVTEMTNIVESPLDSDSLSYAFDGMQKYMTEYTSWGEGNSAIDAFACLVKGEATTYDAANITDWFVQLRRCANWTFYLPGKVDVETYFTGKDQHALPDALGTVSGGAVLMSVGKVQKTNGGNDNSPISTVDMIDYLVIPINGNGDNSETGCYPNADTIKAAIPCAEYNGNAAGGVFSPSDSETTNYIVVSGSMVMNALMPMTATYAYLLENKSFFKYRFWHKTVATKQGGDGRYYTRKHWKAENWKNEVAWNEAMDQGDWQPTNPGFIPYTEEAAQSYSYDYSAVGDSTDKCSKVAVIACMLIIGDKCVVEKQPGEYLDTDTAGTGNGQLSDYVWRKYKPRDECASDDEYYQQSFTIGFDPKIGDLLIGTEYSVQNNLSYTDGVSEKGTAIPIRESDKVSGAVKFIILGPVNSLWSNITRRHPSFWRHTKWGSESVPLLAHCSNIIIKELEVKVCSDNGKMGSGSDDTDIVYMSDTKEDYVNRKDDLEFKITTALTSAECKALGVKNSVNLSSPYNASSEEALLSIYDRIDGNTAKPEQLYVDAYWQEWHAPRVIVEQNFVDEGNTVSLWNLYHEKAMNKTFHVQGISRNLTEGTAEVTLKETFE